MKLPTAYCPEVVSEDHEPDNSRMNDSPIAHRYAFGFQAPLMFVLEARD